MERGWFVTFEGGEGTGKSTQVARLRDHLLGLGLEVVVTREPGGTALAEAVRAVLLDPAYEPDGLTEIFLLAAARHEHVERVIRPALERRAAVLCDRYTDSSAVYQGMVRGVGEEVVARINRLATGALEPDLTIVLDVEPAQALPRAHCRNADTDLNESRLDDEPVAFHTRVRKGFLRLARQHPDRVQVVDASGDPDVVFKRIVAVLPAELT